MVTQLFLCDRKRSDPLAGDLLGSAPIRFEGHRHWDFVPDAEEPLGVVRRNALEEPSVRDMYETPGRLVGVDPVVDLQQGEPEGADVDDVACCSIDLDPISGPDASPSVQHDGAPVLPVAEVHRAGLVRVKMSVRVAERIRRLIDERLVAIQQRRRTISDRRLARRCQRRRR